MRRVARPREVHDARSDLYHYNAGIFIYLFAAGKFLAKGFEIMEIITAAIALVLIVYLFVSIFKPEKF
jgi:K+-transporting ATPase KdpF subunit